MEWLTVSVGVFVVLCGVNAMTSWCASLRANTGDGSVAPLQTLGIQPSHRR